MQVERIPVEAVEVSASHRALDPATVAAIAASMNVVGQLQPITVYEVDGVAHLIAGRHRLAAAASLNRDIEAVFVTGEAIDHRLREISENLHRAELTVQERSDQITEWAELVEKKEVISRQAAAKPGRPEGGTRKAARDLNLSERQVRRAKLIANITPEAKEAARAVGLDDNQSKLLQVANSPKEKQAEVVRTIAARKASPLAPDPLNDLEASEKQVAALMAAWNRACAAAREEFLCRIDRPVMDQRYG